MIPLATLDASPLATLGASTFDKAFLIVVGHEGGYSAVRADSGNWTGGAVGSGSLHGTRYGISAASYPTLDILALRQVDAAVIYRRDYWDKVQGDHLPPALALLVFDAAVNNGVARATRWLQSALGVRVDGVIGPVTMVALDVHAGRMAALLVEFQAQRLMFMTALPTWRVFGLGWARRLCRLPYDAIAMDG